MNIQSNELTDMYLQHSSIILKKIPVRLNGRVIIYELSGFWLESRCSHLNSETKVSINRNVSTSRNAQGGSQYEV